MNRVIVPNGVLILALLLPISGIGCSNTVSSSVSPGAYPYGSAAFHRFVQDSYEATGKGDPKGFHQWMDGVAPISGKAVDKTHSTSWTDKLEAQRKQRSRLRSVRLRADAERRETAELHRWEKKAIPRFSLDHGFEFPAVVSLGERQCLLQSVLLASMLQKSGIDAGAVMVFRNGAGGESNIGHVVTIVKLSDGRDVLADASHGEPFVRHNGLFVSVKGVGYRFVAPVFVPGSSEIRAYRLADSGRMLSVKQVTGLDTGFLRSQFAYYRGERTPGGILYRRTTASGLQSQSKWFRQSLAQCPSNPISAYMLGRVCLQTGRIAEADTLLDRAYNLYRTAGWVPPDVSQIRQHAHSVAVSRTMRGAG
ncbi:MAG TPA: hypothetical protein VGM51_15755 [Armatimonadota bacterium]|jgi:hypothetical protein